MMVEKKNRSNILLLLGVFALIVLGIGVLNTSYYDMNHCVIEYDNFRYEGGCDAQTKHAIFEGIASKEQASFENPQCDLTYDTIHYTGVCNQNIINGLNEMSEGKLRYDLLKSCTIKIGSLSYTGPCTEEVLSGIKEYARAYVDQQNFFFCAKNNSPACNSIMEWRG